MMSITLTCVSNIHLAKAKAKLPLPSFDRCQLNTTWMCTIKLHAPTQARARDISHWLPWCGQTDRQKYVHVTTNNILHGLITKMNFLTL